VVLLHFYIIFPVSFTLSLSLFICVYSLISTVKLLDISSAWNFITGFGLVVFAHEITLHLLHCLFLSIPLLTFLNFYVRQLFWKFQKPENFIIGFGPVAIANKITLYLVFCPLNLSFWLCVQISAVGNFIFFSLTLCLCG
jgi:hypothetical protein